MGFAEGRSEGGSIKELSKQGFVRAAGKVGRKIRWKLVEGTLNSADITSMRNLLGLDQTNYDLERWSNGFQIVPGSLNLICSFLVRNEGLVAGFAFRVGYLDWVSKKLKNEELIRKAEEIIKQYMNNEKANNREELTFEYNHPNFLKVDNPIWWIKTN